MAKEILKDCNLYHSSPTLIACPTCGRTQIDLIPIAKQIEIFLQTIDSDITVAVMGCAVNGPRRSKRSGYRNSRWNSEKVFYLKREKL